MLFISNEIMINITKFLGNNYWKHRSDLTEVSLAMDLLSSDYGINSYWDWKKWRDQHPECLIHLNKPKLPVRLEKKRQLKLLEKNPYIKSIDPPLGKCNYCYLRTKHKKLSRKVYDF